MTFTGPGGDGDYATPEIVSGGTASGRETNGSISCAVGDDFVVDRSDNGITITAGQSTHTHDTFTVCADTVDEPDETFTIGWATSVGNPFDANASNCTNNFYCTTTFTITDDDPTEVSLARVGSGAVTEGGKIEFTVTLGRALVAGETIDVPLSIGGTNVTADDWSLALKPGAVNTGVARRIGSVVRFSGAGARTATLELTAVDDGTADHNETFDIALGANTDFDDSSLGTNVGGGADPHNTDNAFSVTVNEPPPDVSVHPSDAIGREGGGDWAGVELRLARALESGETLTVDYRIDIGLGAVNESHDGVSVTRAVASGVTSGTLTITGPNAPRNITLRLRPAANSVDRWESAVKTAEFKLTNVSGVSGAEAVAGADSAKVFVNDGSASRYTYMNVSGGSTNATTTRVVNGATTVRLDGSIVEEGGRVLVLLDGKAGRKRNAGRPYDPHNVTVGVQHLTTDFDDLGEAHRGHDAFVGFLRRDVATKTDYYNVGVLGMGFSAEMWIPISSDGVAEGDERFRVFIAGTPDYMGVEGAYNATNDRAPGVDFTIRGQPGGGQRAEEQQAVAPPAPSETVSNVQVTAVDAANAKVTWDAVEHATSYEVEYETTSTLVDEDNYVQGVALDWTDTEWTFQHDAAEAMTLTVTVTPAYEDEYGDAQVLDNLAGTATIDVAPSGGGDSIRGGGSTDNVDAGTGNTPQQPDYSALKDTVRGYAEETQHGDDHVSRWKRALAGLGDEDAIAEGYTPMTADEAQDMADTYSASRWNPIVEALTDLESRQSAEPEPDPIPELSLSPGSAVDEGASASFTIHANPAPASDVTVSVTVSQSGDYLDSPGAGARTVTLAASSATSSLAVATVNDGADESDGSVSVSIDSGAGYTVASSNHTASVTVRDDDEPPPAKTLGACVSVSQWDTVAGYYDSNAYRSPNYGANWYRVLIAYHEDRGDQTMPDWVGSTSKPSSAYTVEEAERGETVWSGWTPVRKVLQCLEKESGQSFAPLLPSSSNSAHEGVVRFVNASPQGGSVNIRATDDSGWSPPPVTLHVGPGESIHLTTRDLEQGNAAKGLSGYLGAATGDWRLDVSSERDIEVLPYVRAHDGLLAPMRAIAEAERGVHRVSTFAQAHDPGAPGQTGLLRLINRGGEALAAHIAGTDDGGATSGEVSLAIPAGASVLLTAAELEGGAAGLRGALGDGRGMWRLNIASGGDLAVMNLLRSGGGHLTNLSSGASPALRSGEVHTVPYFPSASDPLGRQGLVRIVNDTATDAVVRVRAHDGTGRYYEPLTLALGAGEAAHLNSRDMEIGNASGGLSGRTGSGTGDWRLDIAGPPGVGVLAYVRTPAGALAPVHDVADASGRTHELPMFNPAGGADQAGQLRIVNPGPLPARVLIRGRDDGGNPSRDVVWLTVDAGESRVVEAAELETGRALRGALDGALGDGAGNWRLEVESDRPVLLMNLAASRDGRIVNLSSGTRRAAAGVNR